MRFGGINRLYGNETFEKFRQAHICVVGLGGVGSWTVEALARSGIGKLTLVDLDDICISNTNRQIHAVEGNYGKPKVVALAERVATISPDCEIEAIQTFYSLRTSEKLLSKSFDVVIDAIDELKAKAHLIASCYERKIPILTCGGAGGKKDPSQIKIADLSQSFGDGLLRELKRRLRKEHEMEIPTDRTPLGIPCVFSPEARIFPQCDGSVNAQHDPKFAGRMGCEAGFGSATSVTGSFGFFMAAEALKILDS